MHVAARQLCTHEADAEQRAGKRERRQCHEVKLGFKVRGVDTVEAKEVVDVEVGGIEPSSKFVKGGCEGWRGW